MSQPKDSLSASSKPPRAWPILIGVGLVAITLASYWPVSGNEFVNFDDPNYLTDNPIVQRGLTLEGVRWAFSTSKTANWHPLTWLSLMIDCELYGLKPRGHHLTSLALHAANVLLLFAALRCMTARLWPSALVAALFAVHPLQVESVAWASQRKNVLSTLFWLITIATYLRYAARPTLGRYALVALPFALGLMVKPMLVTLPCVLLLLDYWPLGRMGEAPAESDAPNKLWSLPRFGRLFAEKLPWFAMSAVMSVVAVIAQSLRGAVAPIEVLPIAKRVANALVAYVRYLEKTIWPVDLAVFYPLSREQVPVWHVVAASALLAAVSALVIVGVRRRPYLAVGWAWFLGTLVPVIGLVQVGRQSMADRYAYVPLIGLFIMVAWGAADLVEMLRVRRGWCAAAGGALVAVLAVCTWRQAGRWHDSVTLFRHALRVTENSDTAHHNLAVALMTENKVDEALVHFKKALEIRPSAHVYHNNLAIALARKGNLDEAIRHFYKALEFNPKLVSAHVHLGLALIEQGKLDDAIAHLTEAVRLDPAYSDAHFALSQAYGRQGDLQKAAAYYQRGTRLRASGPR